jgi:ABC-type transporter Mla subunit MlaD
VTESDPDAEGPEPAGKVRGMASLEDLEARVTALEEQVRQSREDATAARVLAGAADRDVSEFKQLLNALVKTTGALRETQVEDHRDIAALKTEVGSLRADMTSGFTKVNIGMDQIAQLLRQALEKD